LTLTLTTEAHVNVAGHDAGRVAVAGHVNDRANDSVNDRQRSRSR
jgi:hypothetical protein